jgi:hypothetical protein
LKDHENEKKRKKEKKKKEKKKQLTTNPQRKYVVSTRKLDFFFPIYDKRAAAVRFWQKPAGFCHQ